MTLRAGKTRAIREEGEKLAEGLGAAETRLALRGMDGSAAGWLDSVLALERLWALVEQTAFQRLCAECCWVGVQHSGRASAGGGERARGQGRKHGVGGLQGQLGPVAGKLSRSWHPWAYICGFHWVSAP